ncbi:hypothetical protein BDK51DRAFT_40557 [Blyttiomyces helicus]|uniref:Uncharacterized protein n=1 Tax=Blyttiomyces helicus TaxID=388810 RepID=A0A4P9W2H4_9FUNG|nr:hypothetical protein BDK51DRAFT_40557 [Blyttiomyces helicus]|eukprot:RKO86344.1 hypothetical protein BDK51DRAFT_40557 [Blyttiomyces helicus]
MVRGFKQSRYRHTENSRPPSREHGSGTPASSETNPLHVTPGSPVAPARVATSTSRRMLAPVQSIADRIIGDVYHLGTAPVAKRVIDSAGEDSGDDATTSALTTVSKPARKKRTSNIIPLPDAELIHERLDKKPVPTRVDRGSLKLREESKREYALRAEAQLADIELRKDDAALANEKTRQDADGGDAGPEGKEIHRGIINRAWIHARYTHLADSLPPHPPTPLTEPDSLVGLGGSSL